MPFGPANSTIVVISYRNGLDLSLMVPNVTLTLMFNLPMAPCVPNIPFVFQLVPFEPLIVKMVAMVEL